MSAASRHIDPHHARLLRLATNASVATALLLIGVKCAAWLLTGSVSVLASLVDSLMDVLASLINLVAVRYSLKSADEDHQFGHGKAEALAGLGQACFIIGSAIFLVIQALARLATPTPLTAIDVGIGVMLFAILATLALLAIQRHVVKQTDSTAIRADSLHYATDLLTNSATIIALLLARSGWPGLDPLFALAIAAYILYSAGRIGYEATQLLMDRELPVEVRQRIQEIATSHDQVLGIHDLRTRRSGQTSVIQLHLDLEDLLPLAAAHAISREVEARIRAEFPSSDIIIHQDPVQPEKNRPLNPSGR